MLSLRQSAFLTHTGRPDNTTVDAHPSEINFRHWMDEFGEPLEEGADDEEMPGDEDTLDSQID
jgi:hypothetical protein